MYKRQFLFVSYEKIFCSVGFQFGGPVGEWETIEDIWADNKTISGKPVARVAMSNGQVMYAVDVGAQMEQRDYVDAAEQEWLGGQPSIELFSLDEDQGVTDMLQSGDVYKRQEHISTRGKGFTTPLPKQATDVYKRQPHQPSHYYCFSPDPLHTPV